MFIQGRTSTAPVLKWAKVRMPMNEDPSRRRTATRRGHVVKAPEKSSCMKSNTNRPIPNQGRERDFRTSNIAEGWDWAQTRRAGVSFRAFKSIREGHEGTKSEGRSGRQRFVFCNPSLRGSRGRATLEESRGEAPSKRNKIWSGSQVAGAWKLESAVHHLSLQSP